MAYQQINLDDVENVRSFDRVNRIILGVTSIMAAVLLTDIPEAALVTLTAVGMYAGLTAFIGWDPLYALAGMFQRQAPTPTPKTPGVATQQHHVEAVSSDDHKRAA
jgi:hypothetical protein